MVLSQMFRWVARVAVQVESAASVAALVGAGAWAAVSVLMPEGQTRLVLSQMFPQVARGTLPAASAARRVAVLVMLGCQTPLRLSRMLRLAAPVEQALAARAGPVASILSGVAGVAREVLAEALAAPFHQAGPGLLVEQVAPPARHQRHPAWRCGSRTRLLAARARSP